MIEKIGRYGRGVICDNCGDGFEADSIEEAKDRMKEDGWRVVKERGGVKHYCPECGEEYEWSRKVHEDRCGKKEKVSAKRTVCR